MATPLDAEVTALAHRIAAESHAAEAGLFAVSWWADRLLERAMADPAFKTELFRFVDVYPATTGPADVLRHLDEYFAEGAAPALLRAGLGVADHVPVLGARLATDVADRNIRRIASQFIPGTDAADAAGGLATRWSEGAAFTVDLLGEKTVVEAEADAYADRVAETLRTLLDATSTWPDRPLLESDDLGPLPRVNVSVKPTALAPKFAPLTRDVGLRQASERLRRLLRIARDHGAFIHVDMEHADVKDLTLELVRSVLDEEEFAATSAGVVIQAYLVDALDDLAEIVEWSAGRQVPVTVRLVKGAYWDTETVEATAQGWPSPVFTDKEATDANFERCVRLLHDHHGAVRAAFGSHNLRSIAYAVTYARSRGIADDGYELQMLAGMAEPVQAALRRQGHRVRTYTPIGDLVPGMAYLVRRLLENTSNESFVRRRVAEGAALDELLRPPGSARKVGRNGPVPADGPPAGGGATDPAAPADHRPEPVREWRRRAVRDRFGDAVARAIPAPQLEVPAVIDGERIRTGTGLVSVDPSQPSRVVATSACCGPSDADAAVEAARRACVGWSRRPVVERAGVLFRAASWLRERRDQIAALEVWEAGKPWAEADADVCEAIDFCEYYGRQMLRLDRGADVVSVPGESNRMRYRGKGVVAVIAPWNFPLAIPCGMTVGALVTGCSVVLKPAEQAPATAYRLVEALEAAGLPPGVLSFVPGHGEEVGARLVEHPEVDVVAFTGSREVGLAINATAAVPVAGQRSVKRVIAEMGGKNALVVDADADLDQAVPAVVASAFGYSGQKCSAASRLVVLDAVYDRLVPRLVEAARELRVGPPSDMGTELGPLIDEEAQDRVAGCAELASMEGRVLLARDDLPESGWYAGPLIVADVDPERSRLATDEFFGPVLTVLRAADLDAAVELVNASAFALTAGVLSRSPATIRRLTDDLRAGNIYVNRAMTGAVVGRQPFGGFGLSGVGAKAGGPDYLLQFLDARVVTENTVRQGFAPSGA